MAGETFFEDLKRYLRFDESSAAAIRVVSADLAPHIDRIAEVFFARVTEHEEARVLLDDKTRLKSTLRKWMTQLLEGPYDESYYRVREESAHVHVRVGLPQRYMITAMEVVRHEATTILDEVVRDPKARDAGQAALSKLLTLELAIMLETFRKDTLARMHRAERAEQALLAERLDEVENRFRDIVECSDAVVLVFDEDGRIRYMNPRAEDVCGTTLQDSMGRAWLDEFTPPEWRETARKAMEARAHGQGAMGWEWPVQTKQGGTRWLREVASSWSPGSKELYSLAVDVTEKRVLEQQTQQQERLAVAGRMAAGLAHEIRNPLNAAVLQLAVLEKRISKLGEKALQVAPVFELIRGEFDRLSSLVREFLEFARPRPLGMRPGNVGQLLEAVRAVVALEAERTKVQVTVEAPESLPRIAFDDERMHQILLNLVRNSLEAMPDGGKLCLRARSSPGTIDIEVEDTGIGFDTSKPVLDAFYTTKASGTGLGLAIVHRLVTEHGGRIRFESRPQRTVFTISLPA